MSEERLHLIEGVHGYGTSLCDARLAGGERVRIAVAADDQLRSGLPDPCDLRRRGDRRHEDPRSYPEALGGIGDGDAVVAARGRHDPCRGNLAHEEIRERAARLERSRALQLLELQDEPERGEAEVSCVHLKYRRYPHIRPDDPVGRRDSLPINRLRHGRLLSGVEAGMTGINVPIAQPFAFFPFSGWKGSFFGDLHLHGTDGIEFYTRKKVVVTRW